MARQGFRDAPCTATASAGGLVNAAVGVDRVGIGTDTVPLYSRVCQDTNEAGACPDERIFYTVVSKMLL